MAVIYFQNNYLTLYYHAEKSLGHPVWTGFASGGEHRHSVLECVRLVQTEKPRSWLTDNRKMKAIRQADQEWFEKEIVPLMASSSIRKFAVLISEDIFNQMAVENLYSKVSKFIQFEQQYFRSESDALKWLQEDFPAAT